MITICCVCNKIKHQEQWAAGQVVAEQEQLSRGYCPSCYAELLIDISTFTSKGETVPPLPVHVMTASDCVGVCA
jgi:hypothetical protein